MKTALIVAAALVAGCTDRGNAPAAPGPGKAEQPQTTGDLLITGAGSTFIAPILSKWFAVYQQSHSGVHFNYQSIGSGAGIRQITERTVDFGATDTPMTEEELGKAPGTLHVPAVLGSVVVVWNEPEVKSLKLTPATLSGLFLGKITKWNDPALAADNPGEALPDKPIVIVHRADGSGTTAIFTDYLSRVAPEWKSAVGQGKTVKWPTGLGGKGNEGVSGLVKQNPGAVGYVELAYALQNDMPTASMKNHDGNFVSATVETTSAAAAQADLPADFRGSIVDAPGANAYPIASFTFLLLYKSPPDAQKQAQLVQFVKWAIHDGQQFAGPLGYAPLPSALVQKIDTALQGLAGTP